MLTERRYDIDWLRVIAIGLLLIYHIAIVFQPWASFIGFIRSEEPMEGLWKLMSLLNVWRIPFLFYVSGMGVYFAIRKRNCWQLMKERSKRILIPFVFGLFAIAPLHVFVFQQFYGMPLQYFLHPGHLWFLGNIFIYVLVLTPLFFLLMRRPLPGFRRGLTAIMGNPVGPLSLSVFFVAEVLILQPAVFEMYALTWHGFFLGLLAFFFGFLFVYSGKVFWKTVLRWKWLYLGLALASYLVRLVFFETKLPGYGLAIESNCWILGIFGFGYQYLNKPSRMLTYLSRAAYPVYIVHMAVLYMGAALILPLAIPALLKFIAVIAFTLAGCFLLYEGLIRRVGFLRPLFGMKKESRPMEAPGKGSANAVAAFP
ncbi:Surface polysaccharide O-acyltransferase, integral membrane enzyme [Cyclobacterium lianum]|uniref:Surface polysaccharide O-acyltransferase, integral membrane enzyme n=1 Tax=Cyclobacterium lianum TaxID=388280 RepID=A0A1M7IWS4_9BACT|nr:acyltransferase family protein [Cyclobacterium lianum]SHM45125.1 Surface polysaccharide O-acyltransferase, integral membrane enzyme [Cyclobacterium lianum]